MGIINTVDGDRAIGVVEQRIDQAQDRVVAVDPQPTADQAIAVIAEGGQVLNDVDGAAIRLDPAVIDEAATVGTGWRRIAVDDGSLQVKRRNRPAEWTGIDLNRAGAGVGYVGRNKIHATVNDLDRAG